MLVDFRHEDRRQDQRPVFTTAADWWGGCRSRRSGERAERIRTEFGTERNPTQVPPPWASP